MNRHFIEGYLSQKIKMITPLSGGCIGNSAIVTMDNNASFFVKEYRRREIAKAEALGLYEIEKSNAIAVPKVIAFNDNKLILEEVKSGVKSSDFFYTFGKELANLHNYTSSQFGFNSDNFIGSSPQKNILCDSWAKFYVEYRLKNQFNLPTAKRHVNKQKVDRFLMIVLDHLRDIDITPSLLHGDLWSGNYMVNEDGSPVLIDPAVYYGHSEAELAMTKLFGGFPAMFYEAYYSVNPKTSGYNVREDFYTLYHLLNHLNLFGISYLSGVNNIITKYV